MAGIRILLLADSHLGFDLPLRPRVRRRRRGDDFLENHRRALLPALRGRVDAVVHGGDVFDRPDIPASLAWQAYEPIRRVADLGIPVFIVPGNHERARLPHARFAAHPRIRVFDRARTYVERIRGLVVAFSGFPFERGDIRTRFGAVLDATGWRTSAGDVRLLCIHQCVEGATVGPGDYTFTTARDVIRGRDIPAGLGAVLSGHIHRRQVLARDLRGRPLGAPVLYPGSLERTSLAERGEPKGYMLLEIEPNDAGGRVRCEFRRLPSRPLILRSLELGSQTPAAIDAAVRAMIGSVPQDAVLRLRVTGQADAATRALLSARRLHSLAPRMTIEVRPEFPFRPSRRRERSRKPSEVIELPLAF